jgi:hypothetical protein
MPTITTYTYSIANDVPVGAVDSNALTEEIASSTIVTALSRIDIVGDNLYVVFKDALSTADKTILDNDTTAPAGGLIGAHEGVPTELDFVYTKIVEERNYHLINDKFMAEGMILDTTNLGWNSKDFLWPINISALSYEFAAGSEHIGDQIEIEVAPDLTIGALTADVNIGDTVLNVSSSVFDIVKKGYDVHLDDGVQAQERLGRCADFDRIAGTVTVETASTKAFSAATPTTVQISVYVTRGLVIYQPGRYVVGESKIGGTLVPANRVVRMWYYNADGTSKNFAVHFDYLY